MKVGSASIRYTAWGLPGISLSLAPTTFKCFRRLCNDQTVSVILAAAKTKATPLQSVSIPRLELMGAHLGSKLACTIANVLSIPKQHMIFWSDSTDVLW